jgi:hypothetical protein
MDQPTDQIAQLVDVAQRLRTVRAAQRRFMQLWAQQRTELVTRSLFFPTPLPPNTILRRHRIKRRKRSGGGGE